MFILFLCLALLITLVLLIVKCFKLDLLSNNNNYKFKTEIHFITLWEENYYKYINMLNNEIIKYNNNNSNNKINNLRILKQFELDKKYINKLFKNVDSGGKHTNNNIYIIILEVPSIYGLRKTRAKPKGEIVNTIIYDLKLKLRGGDQKNYKIAHSSYNIKETNDFLKEYYDFLGKFKNYNEFFQELNKFNIFWIYDRIDNSFYNKNKDIDLVVDSIPAINFILRNINISNKIYTFINNDKKLIHLQDLNSNYYPKKWLLNILHNKEYIIENNIRIPTKINIFMLSLYHKYIHKNDFYDYNRLKIIKEYSNNLKIKDSFFNLLCFLNFNRYIIKEPNDKSLGFHVKILNNMGLAKNIIKFQNNIYYLFNNKKYYDRDIYIYNKLNKYNFINKIINYDDKSFVLQVSNEGIPIKYIKKHISDFKEQINFINDSLKKENISHNDINPYNVLINNNNKIILIDFEHSIINGESNKITHDDRKTCLNLPYVKNEKNIFQYIKSNKCLHYY